MKGYKLVPVEPTDEMLSAMWSVMHSHGASTKVCYEAMLAVAIPPQPIYDEAKERELFKSVYFRCDLSEDWLSGAFKDKQTCDMWDGWRECAQSRAKSVEVGDE